ncbi:MAG: UbiX family flavin prenyltransferase [Candidatus Eremiobacteraeota bacterium]|nr:UbiX family flavin prenyltransferase [Candidatus Eremiobacteraeota bacterium]MBC5828130.1 UbiX family flavin prenyltransferase [Candidatus Eremiobacteraeota bacterium]
MSRYVVGITGASGVIYGIRTLEAFQAMPDTEVHLVLSPNAARTIELETSRRVEDVAALADVVHDARDLAAPVSSGSFRSSGMIVAPCSVKTASAIAYSMNDTLLVRAADVTLKERRPLVLVVRETPLHLGHLRTLVRLSEMGAVILPPCPGFYTRPRTVDDIVNHTVGKALDAVGLSNDMFERWSGALPPVR